MNRLSIIPCGKKKIWDRVPEAGARRAQEVYIGTFGKACQAYAAQFFDVWVILSAKHGFLFPDDIVPENYDLSFDSGSSDVISIDNLKKQMAERGLESYDEITVLGGKKYRKVVEQLYNPDSLKYPLRDCKGIGYMVQKLNKAVQEGKEI
ncbi:DUF6884 domain-containing protein [Aneurinibacillus tyrosinisolvens]|uniref:DUF6884 domain-containing protein n=1 Tax=Aneurinibacillus tyrosinisolvens TaxID=1443435 RepID=UPI00063F0B32|nr:DUF6884 domain-containing protein [Aneurinibacillus tyrosinisolvens]